MSEEHDLCTLPESTGCWGKKSGREMAPVFKSSKKIKTSAVKTPKRLNVSFRNPRIDISGGETVGITGEIWRYTDLNRIRVKGEKDNTGVCIIPYVDYLLARKYKYS